MRCAPAVAAAVVLAGCGGSDLAPRGASPAPAEPLRPALQAFNGPLNADPATTPLAARLADTTDPVRLRFGRPPRSGLLFDLDTGEVLWRRDPTRALPIASLTKMMTALLVAESAGPREKVRITREALRYQGSGMGVLPRRKRVKLETLLNGLMLVSGNDAAIALAQHVAGSVPAFVERMNVRAAAMGLRCTRFSSPSGFTDTGNHSCAADLVALSRAVLDQPRLARIVARRRAILPLAIKGGRVHLYNTNPLLRTGYRGAIGIKTGYTRRAGRCFVAAARRGNRRLGVILLGSRDPGSHARKLLDRAWRL